MATNADKGEKELTKDVQGGSNTTITLPVVAVSFETPTASFKRGDSVLHVDKTWPWVGLVKAVQPICSLCKRPRSSGGIEGDRWQVPADGDNDVDCCGYSDCEHYDYEDQPYDQCSQDTIATITNDDTQCTTDLSTATDSPSCTCIDDLQSVVSELLTGLVVDSLSNTNNSSDAIPTNIESESSQDWRDSLTQSERDQNVLLLNAGLNKLKNASINVDAEVLGAAQRMEETAVQQAPDAAEYRRIMTIVGKLHEKLPDKLPQAFLKRIKAPGSGGDEPTTGSTDEDVNTLAKEKAKLVLGKLDCNVTVQWHPSLETTTVPSNKLKYISSGGRMCQLVNGATVQHRTLTGPKGRLGIVKQVSQRVGAVVVPDCEYMVPDITDADRLLPLNEFGTHDSCYVWYKAWLGMPYSVLCRARFVTDDGYEFTLSDDDLDGVDIRYMDCLANDKTHNAHSLQRLYPSQRVRFPVDSLHPMWTKWLTDDQSAPEHIACLLKSNDDEMMRSNYSNFSSGNTSPPRRKKGTRIEPFPFDPNQPDGLIDKAVMSPGKDMDIVESFACAFNKKLAALNGTGEQDTDIAPLSKLSVDHSTQTNVSSFIINVTVKEVKPVGMDVEWRHKVGRHPDDLEDPDEMAEPEERFLNEQDIKHVRVYKHNTLLSHSGMSRPVVGHICRYRVSDNDDIVTRDQWRQHTIEQDDVQKKSSDQMDTAVKPESVYKNGDIIYTYVTNSSETADVMWEDGEWQADIPATELMPACMSHGYGHDIDSHIQFFPGMYVVWDQTKPSFLLYGEGEKNERREWVGRVLKADNNQRFAEVQWMVPTVPGDSTCAYKTGECMSVSFYDVKTHNRYNFLAGTLIQRVNPPKDDRNKVNLGHVITKLSDGSILVRWFGDSTNSVVQPSEVHRLENMANTWDGTESDVDDTHDMQPGMYSPTQHDVYDIRRLDLTKFTDALVRDQLIYLMCRVCVDAIQLMHDAVRIHFAYPCMNRDAMLRIANTLNGVIFSLIHSDHFLSLVLPRIRQLNQADCKCAAVTADNKLKVKKAAAAAACIVDKCKKLAAKKSPSDEMPPSKMRSLELIEPNPLTTSTCLVNGASDQSDPTTTDKEVDNNNDATPASCCANGQRSSDDTTTSISDVNSPPPPLDTPATAETASGVITTTTFTTISLPPPPTTTTTVGNASSMRLNWCDEMDLAENTDLTRHRDLTDGTIESLVVDIEPKLCSSCQRLIDSFENMSNLLYDFDSTYGCYQSNLKKYEGKGASSPDASPRADGEPSPTEVESTSKIVSPPVWLLPPRTGSVIKPAERDPSDAAKQELAEFAKQMKSRVRQFEENYETLICGVMQLNDATSPDAVVDCGSQDNRDFQLRILDTLYETLNIYGTEPSTTQMSSGLGWSWKVPVADASLVTDSFGFVKWLSESSQRHRLPCFDWVLPPASVFKKMAPALKLYKTDDIEQPILVAPCNIEHSDDYASHIINSLQLFANEHKTAPNDQKETVKHGHGHETIGRGRYRMPIALLPAFNRSMADCLVLVSMVTSWDLLGYAAQTILDAHPTVNALVQRSKPSVSSVTTESPSPDAKVESPPPVVVALNTSIDPDDVLHPNAFQMLERVPPGHRFVSKPCAAASTKFIKAVKNELKLLHSSLPAGIFVKGYEDRMDLYSAMMIGPVGTPYEHGIFLFDVRLPDDYPNKPPHVFFKLASNSKSMSKSLNPNLYEDGMVCLSLLGTWEGNATELWSPAKSNLLQVFVSILGLVLVDEPFFLEPGYEDERGTERGKRDSRPYNEGVILRAVESLEKQVVDPVPPFESEIKHHFSAIANSLIARLDQYADEPETVPFTLAPVTQGFRLCLQRHKTTIEQLISRVNATSVSSTS